MPCASTRRVWPSSKATALRNAGASSLIDILRVSRPQESTISDRSSAEMASPAVTPLRGAMLPPASVRSVPDDLETGIGTWEGRAVFISETVYGSGTHRSATARSFHTPARLSSTQASGTSISPISVSSSSPSPRASPHPLTRPRAIPHFSSPLPRTAYTPPRATASPSARPIHPFFIQNRPVPKASAPPLVAHYSSTEAESEESFSASQSTFDGSQKSDQLKAKEAEVIDILSQEVQKLAIGGSVVRSRTGSGLKGQGAVRTVSGSPKQPLGDATSASVNSASASATGFTANGGPGEQRLPPRGEGPANRLPKEFDPSLPIFHFSSNARRISVCYTRCIDEADDFLGCIKGNVMGFDLEWPMHVKTWDKASQRYLYPQGKTALIQVGDEQRMLLFHLKPGTLLPPGLIKLIQDPAIYKLGVAIANDGRKLMRDFPEYFGAPGDEPAGLLELSYMARAIDGERTGPGIGTGLIALATLCREYLRKELPKDPAVRRSDWSAELSQEQKDYAANDVFSAVQIYKRLSDLSRERGIPLNHDSYCTNIGRRSTSSAALTETRMLSRAPTTSMGSMASSYGSIPVGKKMPTPAKMGALNAWMESKTFDEIGQVRSIKPATAEGYVYQAFIELGLEHMTVEHRKRLHAEASVVMSKYVQYKELLTVLTAEFGDLPGGSAGDTSAGMGQGSIHITGPTPAPKLVVDLSSVATSRKKTNTPPPPRPPLPSIADPLLPTFQFSSLPSPPSLLYTRNIIQAENCIEQLQGEVLGFNLKWPFRAERWDDNEGWSIPGAHDKTALVQLCDEKTILLLHLDSCEDLPSSLVKILQSPTTYKVGAQIGPGLVQNAWAADLTDEQKTYTANDVYASYVLFSRFYQMAQERCIPLDYGHYRPHIPATNPFSPEATNIVLTQRETRVGGITVPAGVHQPTPAMLRDLNEFVGGKDIREIAAERGVLEATVSEYLCGCLSRIGANAIPRQHRKRPSEQAKWENWRGLYNGMMREGDEGEEH
ncbi:hypothetical protein IAT38_000710 [Cryptococcus sp. DSM 104549]